MNLTRHAARRVAVLVALGALLPLAVVTTTSAGTSSTTPTTTSATTPAGTSLPTPVVPGAAPLPFTGVVAAAATPSATMGNLAVSPDVGTEGQPFTISGSGLPANTSVELTWSTASATWIADVEPNTVNWLGRTATTFNVVLATVTTNASGAFTYATTVPVDFGGIHDIYAVVNGVELDHGGYEMYRTVSVTPTHGPIGTPIHITYTALGSSLYGSGGVVLWDNHYAGNMSGNWTRGTATVTIRATGPVGQHVVTVEDGMGFSYLNVVQSPVPYLNGGSAIFTTTAGRTNLTPSITWPDTITPTVSERTTLSSAGLDPSSTAVASLSATSGPVLSKVKVTATGLSGNGTDQLVWSTVVGSRVNCPTSSCWNFESVALGSAAVVNGTLASTVTIPDGLGGWHVIQVMNGQSVEAQVPFYVKESIVPFYNAAGQLVSMGVATANDATTPAAIAAGQSGTGQYTFKEGQEFTISLKGVGWTQLDNTLAVDYDNSYIGYGCGFNSNGYMVIHLRATGGPGVHLIDLYPLLYNQQPSFANTQGGMIPILSFRNNAPGLALGYQIPSFHFAITIVN